MSRVPKVSREDISRHIGRGDPVARKAQTLMKPPEEFDEVSLVIPDFDPEPAMDLLGAEKIEKVSGIDEYSSDFATKLKSGHTYIALPRCLFQDDADAAIRALSRQRRTGVFRLNTKLLTYEVSEYSQGARLWAIGWTGTPFPGETDLRLDGDVPLSAAKIVSMAKEAEKRKSNARLSTRLAFSLLRKLFSETPETRLRTSFPTRGYFFTTSYSLTIAEEASRVRVDMMPSGSRALRGGIGQRLRALFNRRT